MWKSSITTIALFGLTLGSAALEAQSVQAGPHVAFARDGSSSLVQHRTTQQSADPLAIVVDVQLANVSIQDALDSVARLAGVRVMYSPETVPLARKVSVRGSKVALGEVLRSILQGTGTESQVSPTGAVMIARAVGQRSQAGEGTVTGVVVDARTKKPVPGATIVVRGSDVQVKAGDDGTFRVALSEGEHTLDVRAVGFTRTTTKVMVKSGEAVAVEVVLQPSASVLDEVVVTGTVVATERKAISTPITVITAEEIEKRGITRIEQFFRGEVPGVLALELGSEIYGDQMPEVATNFGSAVSSKVYARGASGFSSTSGDNRGTATPLKTYVDGVEILNPAYLGTIDPQSIDRIEIITGPQAATIYGSGAMGGVMQIFTKHGTGSADIDFTLSLRQGILQNNFSSGLTPRHNHTFGMTGGTGTDWTYALNLSYNYTGQWRPGLWMRNMGASLGLTHIRGKLTASGSFSLTAGKNGSSGAGGPLPSPVALDNVATGEWITPTSFNAAMYMLHMVGTSSGQTASLNLSYQQSPRFQHHLTVGRNQNTFGVQSDRPRFWLPHDSVWTTGTSSGQRSTASYNMTASLSPDGWLSSTITAGINGSVGSQTNVSGCTATRGSTTYLATCNSYRGTQVTRGINDRSLGEFVSWRIGVAQRLYTTLGLRAEHNPAYGKNVKVDWTPTNGIAYTFDYGDMTVKLLGSYGRATRAPSSEMRRFLESTSPMYEPATYVSQLAAPNLTAEYSRGPQGGVEVYYGSRGALSINRYVQTVTDLIQSIPADSIFAKVLSNDREVWRIQRQYQNIGKIRQHGWESTGSLNVYRLGLRGTYSWNDSRVIAVNQRGTGVGSFYAGMSLQQVPTHMANVSVNYAHGPMTLTLTTNYIGRSLQNGTDGLLSYGYDFTRMRAYYSVTRRVRVELVQPGYSKSDLTAQYRLAPWASAILNINNLENSTASDLPFWAPSLGRQTTIGISLRSRGNR